MDGQKDSGTSRLQRRTKDHASKQRTALRLLPAISRVTAGKKHLRRKPLRDDDVPTSAMVRRLLPSTGQVPGPLHREEKQQRQRKQIRAEQRRSQADLVGPFVGLSGSSKVYGDDGARFLYVRDDYSSTCAWLHRRRACVRACFLDAYSSSSTPLRRACLRAFHLRPRMGVRASFSSAHVFTCERAWMRQCHLLAYGCLAVSICLGRARVPPVRL